MRALTLAVAFGIGTGIASAAADAAVLTCEDISNLCVDAGGAKYIADSTVAPKDKKKRIEKGGSSLSMTIDSGRGSLFVNGRYAGTAPLSSIPIPAGPNDIQVRDGDTVITSGVLWVPKGAAVEVSVRHP